ncbi:MAG: hypothetical protein RLZZ15_3458 [Verrucomicrobiota bacterium]|jgi:hypothetical protein
MAPKTGARDDSNKRSWRKSVLSWLKRHWIAIPFALAGFACFLGGFVFSIAVVSNNNGWTEKGKGLFPVRWINGLLSPWVRFSEPNPTEKKIDVPWADLASAWMSAGAGLMGVATFFYLMRQVGIAHDDSELNAWSAKLNAHTTRAAAARARVETLWKGSQLSFEKQSFDQKDAQRIKDFLTSRFEGAEAKAEIERAVDGWMRAQEKFDKTLDEFDAFDARRDD